MSHTYRATVRGRFHGLGAEMRDALLARQSEHGMFAARYTAEGTFLYGPELVGYQFRYLLCVDEPRPDADVLARWEAQSRATEDLRARGLDGRIVDVGLVCVEDVRTRDRARR